ncbi:hypothetical protein GCM10027418_24730 [Mariniluteicoccus endophyticus]
MNRFERRLNELVGALVRRGVPLFGARWLEVRGRRTGRWRGTVVNPMVHEGAHHIVAPRGQTQWVRNLRADGTCRLAGTTYTATELPVDDRGPVLERYRRRWGWQVASFMDAPPDPGAHPVFRLEVAR